MFDVVAAAIALLAFVVVLCIARVFILAPAPQCTDQPLKVCVVLGSGGHTSEMIATLRCLPRSYWSDVRPFFVVSATDRDSARIAEEFEQSYARRCKVLVVPRAREVGQSYVTSIFSTLRAFVASLHLVHAAAPDVMLTNGPGVCVPVVAAGILVAALTFRRRPAVAYFESFACVDHLSASGTILRWVVDLFTVQWAPLVRGKALYTGPFSMLAAASVTASSKTDATGFGKQQQQPPTWASRPLISSAGRQLQVLVTVGSTKFDALMRAVDTPAFFAAMQRRGVEEVLVQKGRSDYVFQTQTGSAAAHGVRLTVFDYRPFLQDLVRRVALVVSHAGAGTILEVMASRTPMVVVPNMLLMSNHQVQLAKALADERVLAYCLPEALTALLAADACLEELREFPPVNARAWEAAFRLLLKRPTKAKDL